MIRYVPARNGFLHLQAFILVALVFLSTAMLATFFFFHNRAVFEQQLKTTLETYAALAAPQFSVADIDAIRTPADMQSPAFLRVTKQLFDLRNAIPNVRYVYIMRKTADPMTLAFVSDADLLSFPVGNDLNTDGQITGSESPSSPGLSYDISDVPALQGPAFEHATSDEDFTEDQWGHVISAYAPIKDSNGITVAIVGMDVDAEQFLQLSQSLFRPTVFILMILLGLFVATYASVLIWRRRIEFLRELEDERSALINLALHQLGAPVAIFRWWLEILRDREDLQSDPKSQEIFAEMGEGVTRMSSIIAALREVSAFESSSYTKVKEPASIETALDVLQKEFASRLKAQHRELRTTFPTDLKRVYLDGKLLAAVLRELISNAIDYSPHYTDITVDAINQMGTVRIAVSDRGYGIPATDLPRIFQKFRRGKNASRYKPAGNGIGLFFSKKAVQRAGGKMWVESEEGKGTTFFFTLPTT